MYMYIGIEIRFLQCRNIFSNDIPRVKFFGKKKQKRKFLLVFESTRKIKRLVVIGSSKMASRGWEIDYLNGANQA
jgi:CTP:phosphocholine cytidylyltransferase-like protein